MAYVVDIIQAVAWPLAAVTIAFACLSRAGQDLIGRLVGRVRKLSAFGVDVELTSEGATRVKADLEATFGSYRAAIRSEFDRQAHVLHIDELRRVVIDNAVTPSLAADGATPLYRSTIHVRDILLNEAMYQLLDYLPGGSASRPAGRTFSMRFGIVGESWRTGESKCKDIVRPGDRYVIDSWGMTAEEAAEAGQGKRSFGAAALKHGSLMVGVFYLDSPNAQVFTADLLRAIEEEAESSGLTAALAELERNMRQRGPALTIFDA